MQRICSLTHVPTHLTSKYEDRGFEPTPCHSEGLVSEFLPPLFSLPFSSSRHPLPVAQFFVSFSGFQFPQLWNGNHSIYLLGWWIKWNNGNESALQIVHQGWQTKASFCVVHELRMVLTFFDGCQKAKEKYFHNSKSYMKFTYQYLQISFIGTWPCSLFIYILSLAAIAMTELNSCNRDI